MSRANFTRCRDISFRHEGGYVAHAKDPGGATNMGITIGTLSDFRGRPVSKQEVRDLTREEAGRIYRLRYWNPVKGDGLPEGMDLVAYDGAVNSGPSRGAKWLQKGLRVAADGKIGAQTLAAALNTKDGVGSLQRACAARMGFLRGLRTFSTFGKGWSRRVAEIEAEAVAMYSRSAATVAAQVVPAKRSAGKNSVAAAGSGGIGGTWTFADVPDFAIYAILALTVIAIAIFVAKAAHNRRRADAYAAKAQELSK